jgi:hypothetical protein
MGSVLPIFLIFCVCCVFVFCLSSFRVLCAQCCQCLLIGNSVFSNLYLFVEYMYFIICLMMLKKQFSTILSRIKFYIIQFCFLRFRLYDFQIHMGGSSWPWSYSISPFTTAVVSSNLDQDEVYNIIFIVLLWLENRISNLKREHLSSPPVF